MNSPALFPSSHRRWMVHACLWLVLSGLFAPASTRAYEPEGPRWPSNKPVVMYVQLGSPDRMLSDGSASWDAVAETALAIWNPCLGSGVQFTVGTTTIPNVQGDRKNSVFFSGSAYGSSFGDDALAVTLYTSNSTGKQFTEADVIVNTAYSFDSYRGPAGTGEAYDLRRVLLHEFGHVLGLDHVAQNVVAIMTPVISDIDNIEADDIAGVESIYGAINGAPPVVTSGLSATAGIGKAFQYQITASNNPISYYASGLPTGLTISTTTGMISGIPSGVAGAYKVTLTATNAAGPAIAPLVLTLHGPPVITSPGQVTAQAGKQFSYQITATDSPTSYLATDFFGAPLPSSFTLNATTGVLSGTMPNQSGNIFVGATNAYGTGKAQLTLNATPAPPVITGVANTYTGATNAYVGQVASFQVNATWNPTSYSASGLPPGLGIDGTRGSITGTPTTTGDYPVTVRATNSAGTGTYLWALHVGKTIVLTSGELTGRVGQPLSYRITGDPMPTSFQFTNNYNLPGISLDPATGIVSGTPTETMTGWLGIILSNGSDYASTAFQIEIAPAFVSSFFDGEQDFSGNYWLQFPNGNYFGYYAYLADPHYIYHFDMGYEYVFDANDGKKGAYFYDFATKGFFYSSPTFPFPYLYDFSLNSVVYYYPSPTDPAGYNTNGYRFFYVFSTGQIISK